MRHWTRTTKKNLQSDALVLDHLQPEICKEELSDLLQRVSAIRLNKAADLTSAQHLLISRIRSNWQTCEGELGTPGTERVPLLVENCFCPSWKRLEKLKLSGPCYRGCHLHRLCGFEDLAPPGCHVEGFCGNVERWGC